MGFDTLGLSAAVLEAIEESGYTTPTPIQAQAIPLILEGRDLIGASQTGTGKTASFVLPMIDVLANGRARARMPRSLILEPTRELAAQVAENFEKYGKNHDLKMALLIGGVQMGDQVKALKDGVDVLIATPGRLMDLFERGKILLTGCDLLVIDEADRMLDMGFIPDLERIFKLTPAKKQTLFFSATMPPEITRLTKQFLKDPVRIEATRPATTAETITQHLVRLPTSDQKAKRTALRMLIDRSEIKNGIVFCNRKAEVDIVAKSLQKHGLDAAAIHGDKSQGQRERALAAFKAGEVRALVATDIAARGIDIDAVTHVVQYELPNVPEAYVHRIGRTARAGANGSAIAFCAEDERNLLKDIQKVTRQTIPNEDRRGDRTLGAMTAVMPELKTEGGDRPERTGHRKGGHSDRKPEGRSDLPGALRKQRRRKRPGGEGSAPVRTDGQRASIKPIDQSQFKGPKRQAEGEKRWSPLD